MDCPPISHISFNREIREGSLESMNEGLLDKTQTDELYPLIYLPWLNVEFSTEKRSFDALKLNRFDGEYSVRPRFLSYSGWTGKVGNGSIQLNFDNETFNFKTYMREIPYSSFKGYEPDIFLAHSIRNGDQPPFLLMQLYTRGQGDNRDDSEAGIYIIRKDSFQGASNQQRITQLKLNGFQTTPTIRWIVDSSGYRSDWPDKKPEINVDYLAPLKSFPAYIDLHFYFAKELVSNKSKIYLKINNATWHWEHADSVYATLYIDPDELTSAIKELDDDNLTLSITAETQENITRLALTLESAKSSIPLNKVIVVSKASDD